MLQNLIKETICKNVNQIPIMNKVFVKRLNNFNIYGSVQNS